jgi:hypothetical protein
MTREDHGDRCNDGWGCCRCRGHFFTGYTEDDTVRCVRRCFRCGVAEPKESRQ